MHEIYFTKIIDGLTKRKKKNDLSFGLSTRSKVHRKENDSVTECSHKKIHLQFYFQSPKNIIHMIKNRKQR